MFRSWCFSSMLWLSLFDLCHLKGIPHLGIRYFSDQPLDHTSREWSNGKFPTGSDEESPLGWQRTLNESSGGNSECSSYFVLFYVWNNFVKYGCRNWFQVDIYIHYAMYHLNIITSYNFSIIWVKLWERAKICVQSCHTSLAVKSFHGDIPKDPWNIETVEVHFLSLKWSTKMPVKT